MSTSGASVENAAEGASGNNVTVSATGQILVRTAGGTKKTDTNAVIEKSNLPDEIKKLVIKIREMQAELRQKAEEMSKINSDVKQNPKQRMAEVQGLRQQIDALTSSINSAVATLNQTMTSMRMTKDDRTIVAAFLTAS
ncbi:hypothetical protein AB4120_14030 [Cupriavidus sp. 2KB_3]|uniref:hypothetical protein n=1 Tax=Cupriavidus sp. 2KB_3 TaxID=3232980 RepID=UPI003F8FC786